MVSSKPAKVLKATKIKDVEKELEELMKSDEFELHEYDKDDPEYVCEMDEHVLRSIKMSKILEGRKGGAYKFCKEKYPELLKRAEQEHKTEKDKTAEPDGIAME